MANERATPTPPPVAWRRGRHLAWRRLGAGEAVLLDLRQRVVYGLDEAAAATLDWLAAPRRLPAEGALRSFLDLLVAEGLLEPADTADDGAQQPAVEPRLLWRESLGSFALQCPSLSVPQSLCADPSCQS